jgi:hypothetical protein
MGICIASFDLQVDNVNFFQLGIFLKNFVIKSMDPDPPWPKMLDPDHNTGKSLTATYYFIIFLYFI